MSSPIISIIMPFYNSAGTVRRALHSVLRQTVADIEVIAIDDGSTDDSFRMVSSITDSRLRLFQNVRNLGVAATRNRALNLARGVFLAGMDADDTCHPRRLEWTLAAMQDNPAVGLCGGWMRVHRQGVWPYVMRQPCRPDAVQAMYVFGNPFCYASVMMRRELVIRHSIRYRESFRTGEDHDFCLRLIGHAKGMNIPRVIYDYRWNPQGLTATASAKGAVRHAGHFRPTLEVLLGRELSDPELALHAQIGNGAGAGDREDLLRRRDWLETVCLANAVRGIVDAAGLKGSAALLWFRICRNSACLGKLAWQEWRMSPLSTHYRPSVAEWLGFAGSMLKTRLRQGGGGPQGGLSQ